MRLETSSIKEWLVTRKAATVYDRHVVPRLHGLWARDLVALAELERSERVLDVACGTGAVARVVAQTIGPDAVIGVDKNPHMLRVARQREAAIDWREEDAARLRLADGAFDVVFCQQGVQFFADRTGALREMHRVLAPGGRLLLSVCAALDRNPYLLALSEALATHVGQDVAEAVKGVCSLGGRDELQELVRQAGFADVTIERARTPAHFPRPEHFVLEHLAALPIADAVARLATEARTALVGEMCRRLDAYVGSAGLSIPFELHHAQARKPSLTS